MNAGLQTLPQALFGKLLYWLVPIGVSLPWWGVEKDAAGISQIPKGYLIMDGTTYRVADYPRLGKILGSLYGGDGVSTFAVPDMRGRAAVGKDDMGGTAANRVTSGGSGITATTLGANGGTETVALSTANLAAHAHAQTSWDGTGANSPQQGAGVTSHIASNTQNAGSGTGHQNVQPTIICNWIIRAG